MLLANATEFVENHIIFEAGNFTTTKQMQDAFIAKYQIDDTQFAERAFQMVLKECVRSKYPETPDVSATRTRLEGERTRGYSGLKLKMET